MIKSEFKIAARNGIKEMQIKDMILSHEITALCILRIYMLHRLEKISKNLIKKKKKNIHVTRARYRSKPFLACLHDQ